MAEKITFEDQTQAPKSRPRPEVRQVAQLPGGLPLPPSKQTTVPSSTISSESGTSGIPRAHVVSSNFGEISMSKDLFGLPEFKFPIASQLKSSAGQSSEFSSIKSPTHLPRMSNLIFPNLIGSLSGTAVGGKKHTSLSKPPDFKFALDQKSRDEFARDVEDSISQILVKRPTDLLLFGSNESAVKHSSDDSFSVPGTGVHKFKNPNPSSDLNKSNTVGVSSKSVKAVKPSDVESVPESHSHETSSAPGASASFQLAETRANVESPEQQDFILCGKRSSDPTPNVSQPELCTEMKRTCDSMPTIAQHPLVLKKSTSFRDKFKSFLRRVGFKKFGKKDEEESTGLMFVTGDVEKEPRSNTRSEEVDKKAKPFPTETYNHLLDIDPILNRQEVETKCEMVVNVPYDSPTESIISGSSKSSGSKSESFITSPEETYVEESTSKSCPMTPATERTSRSTPISLSVERPSSKSSPVSLVIEQRSKSSSDEEYASKSNPAYPSME